MVPEFKPLELPDRFHLDAADGWLGLGDIASANDELDQITLKKQGHPSVLMMRCRVYMASKKWESLIQTSDILLKEFPELHEAWVNRSYALHEQKQTQAAFDALLPAAQLFPDVWVVPYNLACYCAQTGQLSVALAWLQKAIEIAGEKDIRTQALSDPDLKPLWHEIKP